VTCLYDLNKASGAYGNRPLLQKEVVLTCGMEKRLLAHAASEDEKTTLTHIGVALP